MNPEQFEEWWFENNGEETAIEKYGRLITHKEIMKQPSYKLSKCKENAFVEAVWDRAYKDMVGGYND